MVIFSKSVFTGGRDAIVKIFDKSLTELMKINVATPDFSSISPEPRNITLDPTKANLIIGTFGSEIYEVPIDLEAKSIQKPVILMQGHYSPCKKTTNEIWGLAVFPDGQHYATVSDDSTLRIWNVADRKQEKLLRFDLDPKGVQLKDATTQEIPDSVKSRSVGISPDGKNLLVGMKNGSIALVDLAKWTVSKKQTDNKSWVSEIKFAPSGDMVATGSHDTMINIYKFPEMSKKATCKGHSSYIRHIDWSVDGHAIHSNSGDYELLFWDPESGKQNTSGATAYKDEKWATWTCVIGWPVQEIWPPCAKGTDINACDRSNANHDTYQLLAVADDWGKVNIYRYPVLVKGQAAIQGKGHSSHVTNVRFSPDDKYVFSTGGNDGCVFQWLLK